LTALLQDQLISAIVAYRWLAQLPGGIPDVEHFNDLVQLFSGQQTVATDNVLRCDFCNAENDRTNPPPKYTN
jgi:hypothetical protein